MARSGPISALVFLAIPFVILFTVVWLAAIPPALSQDTPPPVGGVVSPAGAMIFYQAYGDNGACGPHCAAWIAAEGVVQWDTFKRLFALLERLPAGPMPVVINAWGRGNLSVATTLGRIIREHKLDTSGGATLVGDCTKATDEECLAIKRAGKPLEASIDVSSVDCDLVCVLFLAGGVHRTLPADAKVVIGALQVRSRLAPNMSEDIKEGLQVHLGDQYRLYLKQMGLSPEIIDIMERNTENRRAVRLSSGDWLRLGIVTGLAL